MSRSVVNLTKLPWKKVLLQVAFDIRDSAPENSNALSAGAVEYADWTSAER